MLELLGLFLSTWAFGSVGGTAYAVANGFSNLKTIALIALINALLVVIWFGIIGLVAWRLGGLLNQYRERGIEIPFLVPRERAGRMTTTGLGVVAALTVGSMWAVVGAYALNANKWLAWAAITPGAVAAGFLWTLGALGIIPFLPSPWWLYLAAICFTAFSIGRKVYRNIDQIRRAVRQIRDRKPIEDVSRPS